MNILVIYLLALLFIVFLVSIVYFIVKIVSCDKSELENNIITLSFLIEKNKNTDDFLYLEDLYDRLDYYQNKLKTKEKIEKLFKR